MVSLISEDRTYTTVQVAELLNIGRDTIYRWMRSNKIRGGQLKQLGNVQVRFWSDRDVAEVRQYIEQHPYKSRGRKRRSRS